MGKETIGTEAMQRILSKTLFTQEEVAWLQKIGAVPVMGNANEWDFTQKKNPFRMRFLVGNQTALENKYACIFHVDGNTVRVSGKSLFETVNAAIGRCNKIIGDLQNNVKIIEKLTDSM